MPTAPVIPPIIVTWSPEALQPVGATERIPTLDVLRGLALLGILVVNVELFGWPIYQALTGGKDWTTPWDVVADWVVGFLAQGKFYPLFSLLFGLGMALQLERCEARGGRFGKLFCRRLLVLLGIGLAHGLLLWEGDILVCYALCGFLLLAFRGVKPATLLVWAAIFLVIPPLIYGFIWAVIALCSLIPEGATAIGQEFARVRAEYARLTDENLRVFARGTVGEIFLVRGRNVVFGWQCLFFFAPTVVAMFLLGLYAGRRRLLHPPAPDLRFIRRTLLWGLLVGLPASVVFVATSDSTDVLNIDLILVSSVAAMAVGGPCLSLAYAAALALVLQHDRWNRWLRPLGAAGQMALTNYLLQSVVCTTIFYSYGLGLYGSVGRAAALGLALVIFAAQVPLSVWWLKRFRFGPAEWIWRSLTYGCRQPMRR